MILTMAIISQLALVILLCSGWIYSCDPSRVKRAHLWERTLLGSGLVFFAGMMGIVFL